MAKRKCPYCKKTGNMEEMIYSEKMKKRYFHTDCYEKAHDIYLEQLKEQERRQHLFEYVARLHNVSFAVIPRSFFVRITDIRNGDNVYLSRNRKKEKVGYTYDVILEAYKQNADHIRKSLINKNFHDNLSQELNYGLAIVTNKLPAVDKEMKQRQTQLNKEVDEVELTNVMDYVFNVEYKPKRNKNKNVRDISRLFN